MIKQTVLSQHGFDPTDQDENDLCILDFTDDNLWVTVEGALNEPVHSWRIYEFDLSPPDRWAKIIRRSSEDFDMQLGDLPDEIIDEILTAPCRYSW